MNNYNYPINKRHKYRKGFNVSRRVNWHPITKCSLFTSSWVFFWLLCAPLHLLHQREQRCREGGGSFLLSGAEQPEKRSLTELPFLHSAHQLLQRWAGICLLTALTHNLAGAVFFTHPSKSFFPNNIICFCAKDFAFLTTWMYYHHYCLYSL